MIHEDYFPLADIAITLKDNNFLIEKEFDKKLITILKIPEFDKILIQMDKKRQNEIEFKGELGYKFKLLLDSARVKYTYEKGKVVDTKVEIFGVKLFIKEPEKSVKIQ